MLLLDQFPDKSDDFDPNLTLSMGIYNEEVNLMTVRDLEMRKSQDVKDFGSPLLEQPFSQGKIGGGMRFQSMPVSKDNPIIIDQANEGGSILDRGQKNKTIFELSNDKAT